MNAGQREDPRNLPLNLRVRGLRKSPTIAINERSEALIRAGREIFRLGLGHSPFPVPSVVVEALRENAARKEYLPTQGLLQLREAVADYHRRRHGTACSGDDVLIGPGSKELMFLLQLVYYGDLLIPTPAWVSYAPQAQIVGRQVRFLQTRAEQGWKLDAGQLHELCLEDPGRPRILVLNYPSNPTGGTYSADELLRLAEVAERFGVIVLSDEIYAELHHRGEHVSIERVYPHGTIVSSGLSKWCGAGGWRLGTFAFPPALHWLLEAMEAVASETYTSTSAPIQYAAVRAFQGGIDMERYLWRARHILGALGRAIAGQMRASGVAVDDPVGAFYLFPDFRVHAAALRARGVATSSELCERLLGETGVAILPGAAFGRPATELTARLAYVDFDGAQALAAAETLGLDEPIRADFLERYCGRTLGAVDRICKWLDG
jgi:aspartate aminotransferase